MSEHYERCPVARHANRGIIGTPGTVPDCTCAEEAKRVCPGCAHHVGDHGLHQCHRKGCACVDFPFGAPETEDTRRWRAATKAPPAPPPWRHARETDEDYAARAVTREVRIATSGGYIPDESLRALFDGARKTARRRAALDVLNDAKDAADEKRWGRFAWLFGKALVQLWKAGR